MVAPIQGPFVGGSYNNVVGTGSEVRGWVRYRQKAPYNLPLKYKWNIRRILFAKHVGPGDPNDPAMFRASISGTTSVVAISPDHPEVQTKIVQATNKAYSDFVSQVSLAQAGLGETFAQYPQAVQMIAERVTTLAKTAALIRRRRFKLAWQTLGLKPPQGWRAKSKTFGGLWLEYHFGWEPLVSDIYNGYRLLTEEDLPPLRVIGKGAVDWNWSYDYSQWGVTKSTVHTTKIRARVQANLKIENKNAHLRQQLGLANPVLLAWNLVPFSFVADWYATVGDFLSQLTDLSGLSVSEPQTVYMVKDRASARITTEYPLGVTYKEDFGDSLSHFGERTLVMPVVKLAFKEVKLPSVIRVATAASLIAGFIRDSKKR